MKKLIMISALLSCLLVMPEGIKAQNKTKDKEQFKYVIDEFADIKVMRYQVPSWDNLSLKQQEYLYYLSQAANSGRDILWDQNYKYNLTVRRTLENILSSYNGKKQGKEWEDFLVYAKRVFFSNGIHHHYAEDKIMPTFSKNYFSTLLKQSSQKNFPTNKGEKVDAFFARVSDIIFNKNIAPYRKENDKSKDIVASSAVNFYEGVTRKEVEEFYKKKQSPDKERPLSFGLNSKVVKENKFR
jgi:dipeptidyl-peptidase-3